MYLYTHTYFIYMRVNNFSLAFKSFQLNAIFIVHYQGKPNIQTNIIQLCHPVLLPQLSAVN